jgi:hypothetical protein
MLGAVFVLVFVLVVALAIFNRTGGTTSGGGNPARTPAAGSNDGKAAPTTPTGTAPVTGDSYPRNAQGVQSAAANYSVALGGSDMFDPAKRQSIVQAVIDPSKVSALQTTFDRSYGQVAQRLGLTNGVAPDGMTLVCRTVPVGTKVDSYSNDQAVVEVWQTGLTGLAGTGSKIPVTSSWMTVTLTMRWSGNSWKVLAYSQKDGPAPIAGDQTVSSSDDITKAVTQFGGFRYAR